MFRGERNMGKQCEVEGEELEEDEKHSDYPSLPASLSAHSKIFPPFNF
jgi:hypothetical protein